MLHTPPEPDCSTRQRSRSFTNAGISHFHPNPSLLTIHLSIHPSLSTHPSISLFIRHFQHIHPSLIHPPTHPSLHPSIHTFIHPFVHLAAIHPFSDPSVCPFIHSSTHHPPAHPSIHLAIHPSSHLLDLLHICHHACSHVRKATWRNVQIACCNRLTRSNAECSSDQG